MLKLLLNLPLLAFFALAAAMLGAALQSAGAHCALEARLSALESLRASARVDSLSLQLAALTSSVEELKGQRAAGRRPRHPGWGARTREAVDLFSLLRGFLTARIDLASASAPRLPRPQQQRLAAAA